MSSNQIKFNDLKVLFINCSIKENKTESHTQTLIEKASDVMEQQGVMIEHVYALDYAIAFGMVKDNKEGV
ncbi:MAG: hypothetical protein WD061_03715 [Candidatus Saccharimonadales bacterium]